MNCVLGFATDIRKVNKVKLNTFALKIIALVAMLIDHLEGSFPNIFPVAFGWIGRIAIPVFMFCVVQGLMHTSNTKKYLFRLYIGSVVMSVGSFILQTSFAKAQFQIVDNFFAVLFLVAVLISLAKSKLAMNIRIGLWVGFTLMQIVGFMLITRLQAISASYAHLANGLMPNVLKSEGSVVFTVLGVLMYVFRSNRLKFTVMYALFCVLMLSSAVITGFTVQNLFYNNYQWMMIIALPVMLSYNGERGKSLRYFFYAFYPLHIWMLFTIANILK